MSRAYRRLLRLLPADLRHDAGDDMARLFDDYRRELAGRPLRIAGLWLAAIRDVAGQAIASRWERPRPSWRSRGRSLSSDVRHGLRLLRRYPSTSILAVMTLAVGIGANTAIFSVVHAVLLRSLPYPQPDQLVTLMEKRPAEGTLNPVSTADFLDWRQMGTSFSAMAAYAESTADLVGAGDPVQIDAAFVSPGFFDVIGVRPVLGRALLPEEEIRGRPRVAILSHRLWQQRFGADPGAIGRHIVLSGRQYEIVGILPASFEFINHSITIWVPLQLLNTGAPPARASHGLSVYGRLKPGVALARAHEEMDRLGKQLEQQYSENKGHGIEVLAMQDDLVKPIRTSLLVLLGGVGFVLLLACVNVSSLLLTRSVSRAREMAVRSALGASRGRLITQTLVESIVLATAGGVCGIGLAIAMVRGLPAVLPGQLSVVPISDLTIEWPVLVAALAATGLTGLFFGTLPALQASKPDITEPLKQAARGGSAMHRGVRLTLVLAEAALAALTLVGAGLAYRSFAAEMAQPLGFDPTGRIAIDLASPQARYVTSESRRDAMLELERRLAALPGVTHVGAIDMLPMGGGESRSGVVIEGFEPVPGTPTRMHPRTITPDYFRAMGISLVEGRAFTPQDTTGQPLVAVVSEAAVRRFWPGQSVLGKRVRFSDQPDSWRTVVGIAAGVRHWGLSRPVNPMLYLPEAQSMSGAMTFVMETAVEPAALVPSARAVVKNFDAAMPLGNARTLDDVVSDSVRSERAQMTLMGIFGVLALGLAALGIYGVMAQLAAARTREVGIRLALGARPFHVLRRFVLEGVTQAAAGLAIGAAAGVWLMRLSSTVLYQTAPWDPTTLAAVTAVLLTSATAATLVPARRAMKTDAAEVLRNG